MTEGNCHYEKISVTLIAKVHSLQEQIDIITENTIRSQQVDQQENPSSKVRYTFPAFFCAGPEACVDFPLSLLFLPLSGLSWPLSLSWALAVKKYSKDSGYFR